MAKILHLIPTLEGGGAERQLAMLAAEQARRGWSVHVGLRREGANKAVMRSNPVTIHALGDLRAFHPLLITRTRRLVARLLPDIVQTWLPQMDVVGGLVALTAGKQWIVSERTSYAAYRNSPVLAWLRCRLGQYADAVIANSLEGAAYWRQRSHKNQRVYTISNAVDVAAVHAARPMSCQYLGVNGPAFLFVGRLSAEKAPHVLVEAIDRVAEKYNVHALFIGDGPLREELRSLIENRGFRSRAKVLPYQENWWGFLKTATALISTSRFEGQPNVVLEAMAARCPLIVSDIPAHRAILDEQSALIVALDNPEALSTAIKALMADPDSARARAKRAFERVASFTIQATADGYERAYASILKRQNQ